MKLLARISTDRARLEVVGRGVDVHDVAARLREAVPSGTAIAVIHGAVQVPMEAIGSIMEIVDECPPSVLKFVQNRQGLPSVDEEVGLCHAIQSAEISAVRAMLSDSSMEKILDDHQARSVAIMTLPGSPGASLFDEQGTGKTVSVLAAFDLMVERGAIDALLVVAPKSMIGEWASEILRFTEGLYHVEILDGSKTRKAAKLRKGADVYVCNYETLITLPEELRLMCSRYRVIVVADESFNVKNPAARRTEALADLREWCVRAYALCGTPAPNDAADVVSQVSFVDMGRAFGNISLPDEHGKRQAVIRRVLKSRVVYTRNLKSMVLPHLPGRTHDDVQVELAPQQLTLYRSVAGSLATELSMISDSEFSRNSMNYLARRAALLRVCSDPRGVDPCYDEIPAKIMALDAILDGWHARGEKVVVWSYYRATLDALSRRFERLGVVRVDGSVADVAERRAAVRAFQNDDDIHIFVGNPAAAGAGITLHSARVAVYESMSNQAAHYLQSLDRIHRRGQTRECRYVTLVSTGTIEESEYTRLRRKAALQADLLGDPRSHQVTRHMMLEEVLASLKRLGGA